MDGPKTWERIRDHTVDKSATVDNRAEPYTPRADDLIVAGHTKCGTTWMQQIMHQIRTGGDEDFTDIYEVTWYLPDYQQRTFSNINGEQTHQPRVYKTHTIYENLPHTVEQRYVALIRDPYDAAHSMIKFRYRNLGHDRDMSVEDYIKFTESKDQPDYFDFITSWYRKRNDQNVFWIHYEDLKRDLRTCIQKLATFMIGKPLEEDVLKRVEYLCSFEYMSKNQTKFDGNYLMERVMGGSEVEYRQSLTSMVRKDGGVVGQGKRDLSKDVRDRIDQRWKETVEASYGLKNYQELYEQMTMFKTTA